MAHYYDAKFMEYTSASSQYAACKITKLVHEKLEIGSVLDVGCAHGTWLKSWSDVGVIDGFGVDGDYVKIENLEFHAEKFLPLNLNEPFGLGRKFDLVQSLEVGEHIDPASADEFAKSIASHAERFILFSAAPPGQGGEFHINEETYDAWRQRFAVYGFDAFDWIRGQISDDKDISYWYRYNMFLYVKRDFISCLPTDMHHYKVATSADLPDVSPWLFQLRKAIVRRLPNVVEHKIARLKTRFFPTGRF